MDIKNDLADKKFFDDLQKEIQEKIHSVGGAEYGV